MFDFLSPRYGAAADFSGAVYASAVIAVSAILSLSWVKYRGAEYVLVHYRWLFVVCFLMPLSVTYDVLFYLRNWIIFRMNSAPEKHDEKVRGVQEQVCLKTSSIMTIIR